MCSCFKSKSTLEEPSQAQLQNLGRNSSPSPNQHPEELGPNHSAIAKNIIVDTKFKLEDIKISEYTPASTQQQNFAYTCPICLRFFSTILTLKCCKQYICHYCIMDLSKDIKFEVACPHCKSTPIHVTDVDFASSVKRYSDSPYGTFKQSANKTGNKWVPMPVVHEDKDFEENQAMPESFEMPRIMIESTKMHSTV